MLGIITGTIKPTKGIGQTVIVNIEERMQAYEQCIRFYIESQAFDKLVFCDNSNTKLKSEDNLQKLAEKCHVELELLYFLGDQEGVLAHGKGYGEGQILEYVMSNSRLLNEDDYFIKITGRLQINNIASICSKINTKKLYFNIPNHTNRSMYDTRMYGMGKCLFLTHFLNAYHAVMDEQGYYLEHVYTDVIKSNKLRVSNFPIYPRIMGISGSTGQVYGYAEWKAKIKDLLSKLQFYSKVRK